MREAGLSNQKAKMSESGKKESRRGTGASVWPDYCTTLLCTRYIRIFFLFSRFLIFILHPGFLASNFSLLPDSFSSFLASRFLLSRFPFPALLMDDGF
jgi:hypothetical protein